MGTIARAGASWDIVLRNVVIDRTAIDDDTEDIAVTYVLTLDRVAAGSGSLAWEAHGYDDAWVKRITLPATPGVLVAVVSVGATVDDEAVTGSLQASVRVVL